MNFSSYISQVSPEITQPAHQMRTEGASFFKETIQGVAHEGIYVPLDNLQGVAMLQKQLDVSRTLCTTEPSLASFFLPLHSREDDKHFYIFWRSHSYISLDDYISQTIVGEVRTGVGPFKNRATTQFINVSSQIAEAVEYMHQCGVFHGNINGSNVLIDPLTEKIICTDFSAVCYWREAASGNNLYYLDTPGIDRDWQYVSPEQWDVVTSPYNLLDYRTDLYSLGVLFYFLLSGETPFSHFPQREQLRIAHCEITAPPLSLKLENCGKWDRDIVVSDIVHKLLEKNTGRRYPSAASVRWDLQHLPQLRLRQRNFRSLYSNDSRSRKKEPNGPTIRKLASNGPRSFLKVPTNVFGIAELVKNVVTKYQRLIEEKKSVVYFIEGSSGLGKSTLARVCAARIASMSESLPGRISSPRNFKRAMIASGKFEQIMGSQPNSAIRSLLADLLNKAIQVKGVKAVIDAIRAHMNTFAIQILTEQLIPLLGSLFTFDAELVVLSASENRTRLEDALSRWIKAICALNSEYPIALVLDDLQWATQTCISLINAMVYNSEANIMFIITHRPTESVMGYYPVHKLNTEYACSEVIRFHHIQLTGLQIEHTEKLVSDMIGMTTNSVRGLVQLLHTRTAGNPFFVTQLLAKLYLEKILVFDVSSKLWRCDQAQVEAMPSSHNVVEMVISEINYLSSSTRRMLQIASCTDSSFDIHLLSVVTRQREDQIIRSIRKAVYSGFIQQIGKGIEGVEGGLVYRFIHDRIQEGFYSSMPDQKKIRTHYEIGSLLLETNSTLDELDNRILFGIAKNLNLAKDIIDDPVEQHVLLQVNLLATSRASETGSFQQALTLAQETLKLLDRMANGSEEVMWEKYREEANRCFTTLCECQYLLQNEEACEHAFQTVLAHSETNVEKVDICQLRMKQLNRYSAFEESLAIGLRLFRMLGADLHTKMPMQLYYDKVEELKKELERGGGVSVFDTFPRIEDENVILFHQVAATVLPTCYLSLNFTLYGLIPVLGTLLALQQKRVTRTLCLMLSFLSVGMQGFIPPSTVGREISKMAWKLAMEYNDPSSTGSTGIGAMLTLSMNECSEMDLNTRVYRECIAGSLRTHDINTYVYVEALYLWNIDFYGLFLPEYLLISTESYRAVHSYKKSDSLVCCQGAWYSCHRLMYGDFPDETAEGIPFMSEELIDKQPPSMTSSLWFILMKTHYILGEYEEMEKQFDNFTTHLDAALGLVQLFSYQFWGSLVALRLTRFSLEEKIQFLDSALQNLAIYVQVSPTHFLMCQLCIQAEKLRLTSNSDEIFSLYERSIAEALKRKQWAVAGAVTERLQSFCHEQGLFTLERKLISEAITFFENWGATAKCTQLQRTLKRKTTTFTPRATQQTQLLASISDFLSHSDANRILTAISQILRKEGKSDRGFLFVNIEERIYSVLQWEQRNIQVQPSPQDSDFESQAIPLSALKERVPVSLIQYVCSTPNLPQSLIDRKCEQLRKAHEMRRFSCIPLKRKNIVMGALYLENYSQPSAFQRSHRFHDYIAEHVSIVIEFHYLLNNMRKTVQQEQVKNRKLEQLNTLKDSFVQSISDELKYPLSSILGACTNVREHTIDQEQAQILDMLSSSAQGLLLIINDITDFQLCQRNELQMEVVEFDLQECLDECAQIVRVKPNIALNVEKDELLHRKNFRVVGDKRHLKQVISNLMSNAVKFTERGNVILTCTVVNPTQLNGHLPLTVDFRFVVSDTGIGISEEGQQELFKAFTQLDGSTTRKHSGTGLGLALSQLIIKTISDNQSTITCTSAVDQGSQFSFVLPMKVVAQGAEETFSPSILEILQTYSIFLVSQNAVTARIFSAELRRRTLSVELVSSITELPKTAEKRLVFIDADVSKDPVKELQQRFAAEHEQRQEDDIYVLLLHTNKLRNSATHITRKKSLISTILYLPLVKGSLCRSLTRLLNDLRNSDRK